jgi:putative membrane protein
VIRRPIDYLPLFFKGAAMGVADTVPGVSGGTVAFITGIYEELIESLAQIGPARLNDLRERGLRGFWYAINGHFLLTVFAGLLIALFSVAELMSWLISHHRVVLWAFFFGLIAASIPLVLGRVRQWRTGYVVWIALGIGVGLGVTLLGGGQTPDALWMVFLAGLIAVSAMVLPGISGSFLLLILGQYEIMVRAAAERDVLTLAVFAGGAVIGLLSVARVLSKLFRRHHDATVALLTGFMAGSLNALWPWQASTEGAQGLPRHLGPMQFEAVTGHSPQWGAALVFFALGLTLVALVALTERTASGHLPADRD